MKTRSSIFSTSYFRSNTTARQNQWEQNHAMQDGQEFLRNIASQKKWKFRDYPILRLINAKNSVELKPDLNSHLQITGLSYRVNWEQYGRQIKIHERLSRQLCYDDLWGCTLCRVWILFDLDAGMFTCKLRPCKISFVHEHSGKQPTFEAICCS